jgi:hypothetical protein
MSVTKRLFNQMNNKTVLREILWSYLDQVKRVNGRCSPYCDTSLDSLASSRSSLSEGDIALKRWLTAKDHVALERINIDKLVDSLVLAPFPAVCRKLHDLERPSVSGFLA